MNSKTWIRYRLTWKQDLESFREEAYFACRTMAETWFDEKVAEGKSPQLWKEETTTTFEALRPQEEDN